ncbi:uncharacterized protein A1O5_07912 [Cladophialophora psammophila CBS 110553]|uniref:Heterokaryon incompatibility domain-containing protein n=1 Tax=Cladophialophora psammophila CBS 110553 TaxID=1182543 RepID=W9WLE8_9EURO|nr:uncharacterized protein A1O5_07912 [Cladophialophora psammophila CBS 110553]EXJ68977.1 hypothetical protein A1O5_07912 [Cladophialophora psammophila CBS 110553]
MSENRPYIALSYVCGKKKSKIHVNGQEQGIYENLYLALPALYVFALQNRCDWEREPYFWIDQVSIDQSDAKQKAKQMLRMTDIYSRAKRVLIWLGPTCGNLKALLQSFARVIGPGARRAGILAIGPNLATSWPDFPNNPELRTGRRQVERFFSSDDFRCAFANRLDMLRAFEDLTWNEWFARTWTIQEHTVANATVFALGDDTFVDGDDFIASILCCTLWFMSTARPLMQSRFLFLRLFRLLLFWYYEKPGLWNYLTGPGRSREWNSRASTMLGERRKRQRQQNGDHTETNLKACLVRTFIPESTDGSGCSWEIDRIWALFGMCTDRSILETAGFPLDYNTPWREAYREVSRTLIRLGHTDLLGIESKGVANDAKNNTSSRETSLPSWTTDWSVPLRRPLCGLLEDGLFKAATHLQVALSEHTHVSSQANTLAINGYCLGPIQALGATFTTSKAAGELDYVQADIYLREIEAFVEKTALIPSRLKAHAKAYIPVHGLEYNYLAITCRADTTRVMRGFGEMKKCTAQGEGPVLVISQDLLSYKTFMERCLGKRPFITTQGHVGLCTGQADVGDVLGAVAGAPGLIILRAAGKDTDHGLDAGAFEVMGEAFAYGIMDGEIAGMGDVEERHIALC